MKPYFYKNLFLYPNLILFQRKIKYFIIAIILCFNYILLNNILYINKNNIKNKDYTKRNIQDIKVCLCIMGKEENSYAKEYINHYKKLGYNHIFLYDNNNINGEKFEDVLKDELEKGFISIINFRGKKGKIGKKGGIQLEIYYDCYEKNNKNYDWLSFFDFDEFLELNPKNQSIQNFLSNKRYEKCQNIKINFLYFSDNELLYYDNRSVQERFTSPLYNHPFNNIVKSTVRGGLKENYWKKSFCAHSSAMRYISCNSSGNRVSHSSFNITPFNHTYAFLKHYYTKSVQEYCHKTERGEAFYPNIKFNYFRKKQRIDRYFQYNIKTKEKLELFKNIFKLKN